MRFLCTSDVHGHATALRAVLAEGNARDFQQLLVCGDLLFPGPEPLETWRILLEQRAVCTQGVGDRAVATIDPSRIRPASDDQRIRLELLVKAKQELGELIVARLGKLPPTVRLPLESGDELVMVHGSPADPTEPFTHDMSDQEMLALVGDDPADIILCGGSHVPFHRRLDEIQIINVGSVGEAPTPGIAHATLLAASSFGVTIEQFEVKLP